MSGSLPAQGGASPDLPESRIQLRELRELVITHLGQCFAHDYLDVEEFENRIDVAHRAVSRRELDALVADLSPAPVELPPALVAALHATRGSVPSFALQAPGQTVPAGAGVVALTSNLDDGPRAIESHLWVVASSVERRGRWQVPRNLKISCFWGNNELDLRDADIGPGLTQIRIAVTMGNIEIIVPPELSIDIDVSAIAGNVEERHRAPATPDPTRPLVRVSGYVAFGNLEINTRLRGESRKAARKRQRRWSGAMPAARPDVPGTRTLSDTARRALPGDPEG